MLRRGIVEDERKKKKQIWWIGLALLKRLNIFKRSYSLRSVSPHGRQACSFFADRQVREECAASTISDDPDSRDHVDDDFEVQNPLLTEEVCDLKEKIWEELNKDYLHEKNAISCLFFFFLFNLLSPLNERYGMANMDIIVTRLKKKTDLRNGIIKSAKKRKTTKPRVSNSKEMAAIPADRSKNMLVRRSYSNKINYKPMEGLFENE